MVPTEQCDVYRVRTGYEKILAHRTRPPFAYAAKQNGVVSKLNEELKMFEVTYTDGTVEAIQYGDLLSNNPGGGFNIRQSMILNDIKLGTKFKRGDVLAYNNEFFKPDPYSKQVNAAMGITALVALIEDDITLEDCSAISKKVAERMIFHPVYQREVVLNKTTTVHDIVSIGDHVSNIDPLIIFDEAAVPDSMSEIEDKELVDLLGTINRATPKAKHDGKICRIEVFHRCELTTMSNTLRTAVKKIIQDANGKSEFAKSAINSYQYHKPQPLTKTTRVGMVDLDDETVVIRFYIEDRSLMGGGSKLIFSNSLKSVPGEVMKHPVYTEDGLEVGALTSFRGQNNRLVVGVLYTGVTARILEELEKQIIDIWES